MLIPERGGPVGTRTQVDHVPGHPQRTEDRIVDDASPLHLDPSAPVYVAGHRGLVGSAVWRALVNRGFTRLIGSSSEETDLRDRAAVFDFFATHTPEVVILAAAKVGGIWANATYPAEFLSDNLRIQTNVLDAAAEYGVPRLLFLGSSCIYPRLAPQPIPESALLTGPLEETNDAYAIAKIAGITQIQALRRQHGLHYISAMPTNLYGPEDNFDPQTSHVLPAMIRRFHEAQREEAGTVTIWGSGTPRREFLFVDDLAEALIFLLEHYDSGTPINVGTGSDVAVLELAELVADVVGWRGRILTDPDKPDGTPRKLLDVSRIHALGWQHRISLREGLTTTYAWYREHASAES
jgi:GDP-L-fucose synthase